MFLGLLQILSWVGLGYNIRAHSFWACMFFIVSALALGSINAVKLMAGVINNVGDSSKSK